MAIGEREQYLIAIVGADITQFRKGMRDVRSEIGFLNESTSSALGKLGRTLTYTLTTPLLAASTVMVKAASDFDASMRNINSIALMSEEQFGRLSDQVLDFGKTTRDGVVAASESLYTLYSAGLTGALAFDVMEVSTKTAEAGLADLTVTSEALASAMLSFGFTTEEEAWRVSNALTRMVQIGVGSMQSFAGSIATFMPSAAALGVPIEEVFALNARLTQMGYSASEAAVRVNASMRSMIKPSEAMTAAFSELGVKSTSELIAKFGGLTEGLIALRNTTDGSEEALAELFSDTRALQGVLLFTQDIETTRQVLAEFNKGLDTATMDAWTQQSQSFAFAFDRMKSVLGAVSIVLGQQLLPIIQPLIEGFTTWLMGITELNTEQHRLMIVIGLITAALPPLIWLISSMMSPLGLIVGAVAGIKHAFDTDFMGIATTIENAVAAALVAIEPLKTAVQGLLDDLFYQGDIAPVEGTTVPMAPGQAITPSAMGTINIPIGVTYTVEEGDSFWQIWSDNFREQYPNFNDFMASTGLDSKIIIHPGDVINIGASTTGIGTTVENILSGGVDMAFANASDGYVTETAGFWDRLSFALWNNAEKLKEGFNQALVKLKPVIDEFGGQLFSLLADAFKPTGSTGMGNTWVYDTIVGGIESGASVLGGGFAETFPNLAAGLNTFWTNLGEWLRKEAVPTISRAAGFIVATLGIAIGQGLGQVWDYVFGGSRQSIAGDAVAAPFMEGINDAFESAGFDNMAAGDKIVTAIAGGLGALILLKKGLFGGVALAIDLAVAGAMAGASWLKSKASITGIVNVIAGFGSAIWTGVQAAAAWGAGLLALGSGIATGIMGAISGAFTAILAGLSTAFAAFVAGVVAFITSPAMLIVAGISIAVSITAIFFEPINEFWDNSGIRGHVQNWANDLEMRINTLIQDTMAGNVVPIQTNNWEARLDDIDFSATLDANIETTGTIDTTFWDGLSASVNEAISGVASAEATTTAVVETSDAIVAGMADNISIFMADGLIEETEVATAISEPIFNALNPVFGEGGTVRTMWRDFTDEFLSGTAKITLAAGLLGVSLPTIFTAMKFGLNPVVDAIIAKFNELLTVINSVKSAVGDLGTTIVPVAPTGGNTPTETPVTPPSTDIEMDEGAIVLPENTSIPSGLFDPETNAGTQSTEHNETINIYGVQDVNTFIRELGRRGIYLERRS